MPALTRWLMCREVRGGGGGGGGGEHSQRSDTHLSGCSLSRSASEDFSRRATRASGAIFFIFSTQSATRAFTSVSQCMALATALSGCDRGRSRVAAALCGGVRACAQVRERARRGVSRGDLTTHGCERGGGKGAQSTAAGQGRACAARACRPCSPVQAVYSPVRAEQPSAGPSTSPARPSLQRPSPSPHQHPARSRHKQMAVPRQARRCRTLDMSMVRTTTAVGRRCGVTGTFTKSLSWVPPPGARAAHARTHARTPHTPTHTTGNCEPGRSRRCPLMPFTASNHPPPPPPRPPTPPPTPTQPSPPHPPACQPQPPRHS
jgi:hypothetical protein